jgi:hypothetical protein
MHRTNKTDNLATSPCDHRDAVGDYDYNDSNYDYDDVEKEEEVEGH